MTAEEIAKLVEEQLATPQTTTAIHNESMKTADLCLMAFESALSSTPGQDRRVTPRERLLMGSILYTVITRMYATSIAAGFAAKFMETAK